MKSLRHLGGIFAVSKPPGLTSAETCNRIRNDLLKVDVVVSCADHLLYELSHALWNGASYLELEKFNAAECVSSLEAGFKGKYLQSALKIGHGGTLDSYATGVLPIGLGPGCQLLSKLLHSDKRYTCQVVLGLETATGAANGNTIRQMGYDHVDHGLVTSTVKNFVGQISQVPPIYSALKCDGRRLSDYARAGEPIPEKKLVGRPIVVHKITCTDFNPPYFTLRARSEACSVRVAMDHLPTKVHHGRKIMNTPRLAADAGN